MLYAGLGAANLAAWTWALLAFADNPALLAAALGVYGLGLRHGFDADHIAAIDNVTRRLVQTGARTVTVGLFFALGHSTIVSLAAMFLANSADAIAQIGAFRAWGGAVSTAASATFLLVVAGMNMRALRQAFAAIRRDHSPGGERDDKPPADHRGGPLHRLLRPLLGLVSRSWHMFPLGFLFGLGFDTATEVAMFGIAAGNAASGLPLLSVLVFPALFAAAMASVDATDGVVMLGAYEWAHVDPRRKLKYNLVVTVGSVCVAVLIACLQITSIARQHLAAASPLWSWIDPLSERMSLWGLLIVASFMLCWASSRVLSWRRPVRRRFGTGRDAGD